MVNWGQPGWGGKRGTGSGGWPRGQFGHVECEDPMALQEEVSAGSRVSKENPEGRGQIREAFKLTAEKRSCGKVTQ